MRAPREVIIYGGEGLHRREMFFLIKNFLIQPLKFFYPTSYKNKCPPLAKKFTKVSHSVVTHVLYHFCDTTAGAIFSA
jgi:hypothetical protein